MSSQHSPIEKSFGAADPLLEQYAKEVFGPEDPVLREIRDRSQAAGLPPIQVGPMDSLHLEVLARVSGARKAVEIGTLGGYSGVSLLRGLQPEGKLYTFEYEPKHAEVARESFRRAGFGRQVEVFVGPAIENLSKIASHGPFDLVFIDADKTSYPAYLNWAAEHLRVGGLVMGDNTLAWGMIADKSFESDEDRLAVQALREFNRTAASSGRFRATLMPTAEGLTVAVKVK